MSVDTNIDVEENLFGKHVDDLQENIEIGEDEITGTLKYVTGYTEWSPGNVEEQSGNYLALHVEAPADATVQVKLTRWATLDTDRIVVARIADKDSQTITVVVSKDGAETITKVYSLSGLTCNEE